MKKRFSIPRILAVVIALGGLGASGYFIWESLHYLKVLDDPYNAYLEAHGLSESHEAHAKNDGAEGHGEEKAEAKKEEASAGGHGGGGEASEEERKLASQAEGPLIVTLKEVFVNISNASGKGSHFLKIRLDLELFDDVVREEIEKSQAGLRDAVISVSRSQPYSRLSSLSGKLYFKEQLVSRINGFLRKPAIREVHFSEFYLQ